MFSESTDPQTPVGHSSSNEIPSAIPEIESVLYDADSFDGSSGLPPDIPIPPAPSALASPFHPGTTLGPSSKAKVDRFQDVRNLFAKRSLRRQDSVSVDAGARRCFCEKELEDEDDIYCSSACARLDAMSSLCFAESQRLAAAHTNQSSISSLSSITSSSISGRSVSGSSMISNTHARTASDIRLSPSQASHYRRMTSEEIKRQRAGHSRNASHSSRRRHRPEGSISRSGTSIGSMASIISTGYARVPELVGGHPYAYTPSHSRNPSAASSSAPFPFGSTASSISRHPSLASTHSRNGSLASVHSARGAAAFAEITLMGSALPENGGLTNVREEVEDEIERLADAEEDYPTTQEERLVEQRASHHDFNSEFILSQAHSSLDAQLATSFDQINSALSARAEDPFGMGKDMQDVLDEIIMMEQGFQINSSESEHDTDGESARMQYARDRRISQRQNNAAPQSRPRTPPLGLEASRRKSMELPAAPQRSSHHSNDYTCVPTPSQPLRASSGSKFSRRSRYSRHIPSRSEPFLETSTTNRPPFGCSSAQLPSAFEDAMEEEEEGVHVSGEQENTNQPHLAYGRRSFTRRSRSEIRRSLTFVPPSEYRASLLTSIQEANTPRPESLRTPLATNTLAKRRNSMTLSVNAADARLSAHPYRRSALRGLDDSVTRFQFPKMANGDKACRRPLTIVTALESLEEAPALLTPLQLQTEETLPLSAEPMDVNTPIAQEFPQSVIAAAAAETTGLPNVQECLAPSLFPASPVTEIATAEESKPTAAISVPSSGLRLGVLLGSGDDGDDDAWLRPAGAVDEDDEDDSMDGV